MACHDDPTAPQQLAPPPGKQQSSLESCRVTRILDGDTFDCAAMGRVRFIGIDAPEMGQIPYGAQAREELNRLMPIGTGV